VLKLNNAGRNDQIFRMIATDFIRLSQLKFSSNVIEKCLESKMKSSSIDMILSGAFQQDDATLIQDLSPQNRANKQLRINVLVDKLIFHQFGNYVLQKIISVVQSQSLRVMVL
jgi:hypothetical protein